MSELYHHQIKGAKWGVMNGPPYPLNPEDHSKAELKANPSLKKQADDAKAAAKAEQKSEKRYARFIKISRKSARQSDRKKLEKTAKSMSDDELRKANARLTLENTYMNLMEKNSPAREKKMKWAREAIGTALKTVGTQLATVAISKAANSAISSILGQDVEWVNPMTGREPQVKKQDQNSNSNRVQQTANKAAADIKSAKKQAKESKKVEKSVQTKTPPSSQNTERHRRMDRYKHK